MNKEYSVVVGNVGNVITTFKEKEANAVFREYVAQSKSGSGRACSESVAMFADNELIREYTHRPKWNITIMEIYHVLLACKRSIYDECRAFDEADAPSIQVTFATSDGTAWSFQTGDNSYSGGRYLYRHWSVQYVFRNSNCYDMARDVVSELKSIVRDSE